MKIVLTIDYSPWSRYSGGAQLSTHYLASSLGQRGHSVHVVYTKPPWERVPVPDTLPYRLHWAILPALRSNRRATFRSLSALSVARVVRDIIESQEGSVVIHCNGEEGGCLGAVSRELNCPLVCTPRHVRYPTSFLEWDKMSIGRYLLQFLTEPKYLMQRRAARAADLVAPASKAAATLTQEALGIDPEKITVVKNGVSGEYFQREPGYDPEGFLIFFGRIDEVKGVGTLIRAIELLGSVAEKIVIVGRGPEKARYKRLVDAAGMSDRITFRDWMTQADLARFLKEAQLAVLPSRHESFGVAIANAMASGLPVISTRVDAIPELIEHGVTGYLVEPDDPVALANGINLLTSDKDYASGLASKGAAFVRSNLTWDKTAEKFEAIYASLLAATG
ncbi:MAG: glycosyltransferase family 4 protein [Rhodothermales bacterium]|nr:glycosyltransferase family 4 protein [Rhodothermales bacterium]